MIVAAAIKKDGVVYALPKPLRHHNIIHAARIPGQVKSLLAGEGAVRGFIAKVDGRAQWFLNRAKAAEHAAMEGQVETGKANIRHVFNGRELFLEDLW